MRRWLVGFGLALLAGGALVATTAPAGADDCSARLKDAGYFKGIGDSLVVEDCLRSGGNFGRTVGVVVGVTGVLIAVTGLPGVKVPGANALSSSEKPSLEDCVNAFETRTEIEQALDDLGREKERIGREWDDHRRRAAAFGAKFQAEMARRHSQSEWAINSMVGRAVSYTAIGALVGQVAALLAGTSAGFGSTAVASGRGAAGRIALGSGALGAGVGISERLQPDLFGSEKLFRRLLEIWSGWPRWIARAEELNREMKQWQEDSTAKIRKTQSDLSDIANRYNALVPRCTQHLGALDAMNLPESGARPSADRLGEWRSQSTSPLPTQFPAPEIPRFVIRPWFDPPGAFGSRSGGSPGWWKTRSISREIAAKVGAVARFEAAHPGVTFPGQGMPSVGLWWSELRLPGGG